MRRRPTQRSHPCPAAATLLLAVAVLVLSGWTWPLTSGKAPAGDEERLERVHAMYADYRRDFPEVADISPEAAMDLHARGEALFVDARGPEEQAVSMIPGALTAEAFQAHPESLGNRAVIVYCTIGYRSGKLARELLARGMAVANLEGGLLGWVHAGGPLADADGPVARMHVYGKRWDLAPSALEAVY
jgi:rhodanese-related sulfurtransferase